MSLLGIRRSVAVYVLRVRSWWLCHSADAILSDYTVLTSVRSRFCCVHSRPCHILRSGDGRAWIIVLSPLLTSRNCNIKSKLNFHRFVRKYTFVHRALVALGFRMPSWSAGPRRYVIVSPRSSAVTDAKKVCDTLALFRHKKAVSFCTVSGVLHIVLTATVMYEYILTSLNTALIIFVFHLCRFRTLIDANSQVDREWSSGASP